MATVAKPYPPIVIGFFARGLNTNRQPLFSALTGVGLQVIQFKDYLIDGLNVECSDHFTLQRAPGFVKFSSAQLANLEKVNQFYSTRDLSGNVYPLVDTNQNLYKMTPSALTSILTKGTTAQGYIQRVGGVTYYADGTDLKKWFPPAASMVPWGITAPLTAPVAAAPGLVRFWQIGTSFSTNQSILDANGNVENNFFSTGTSNAKSIPTWALQIFSVTVDGGLKWENYGPINVWAASTAEAIPSVVVDSNGFLQSVTTAGTTGTTAPTWNTTVGGSTTDGTVVWNNIGYGNIVTYASWGYIYAYRTVTGNLSSASPAVNTGPILSPPFNTVSITAWSITTNVISMTAKNSLAVGQKLVLSGFPTSTFFNGVVLTVASAGASSFTANFTHADGSATEAGLADPIIVSLSGASSANSECNSTATITSVQVTNGIATITAANNFTPGINVSFSGVGTATFLNGTNAQVVTASPTSFTISLPKQANYGPTADSGTATFLAVEIYRTADGGGVYYFDGAALNGGTWTFNDISSDSQLATALVCPPPGAHLNDPPPAGATLLAWWNNRVWIAVGNKLYFSGGPDVLNGVPEECVPPGNVFVFPGEINSLNATTGGLVVTLPEEVWAMLGGPQTFSLYPEKILSKFGALSPNCVFQDGDILYVYSSQKQLMVLSGAGKIELGAGNSGVSPVADILANGTVTSTLTATAWTPTGSYLTVHRQGQDSGVYLSNGNESFIRYGLNVGNFSPIRQTYVTGGPVTGALNSVETSPGQYSLLMSPPAAGDFIYARSLTTFSDNGRGFPSNVVIGNIVLAEPGQPLFSVESIVACLYNRGHVPTVSFAANDITPSAYIPLSTVLPDPSFLPAPANLMSKRWPLMMNQIATPIQMRHLQVKVDFGSVDTVENELIAISLLPSVQ